LDRPSRILSLVAIGGWLVSLLLPALSFRFDYQRDQILFGWQVLIVGYFHLFVLELSWLANFTFWLLAWILWFRRHWGRTIVIVAVITLLLTAQSAQIFIWDEFFEYPKAFAGYFVWVASNATLCAAALVTLLSNKSTRGRQELTQSSIEKA